MDKSRKVSIDGLNQMFYIKKDDPRRVHVRKSEITEDQVVEQRLLISINTDSAVNYILSRFQSLDSGGQPFNQRVEILSKKYKGDERIMEGLGVKCKKCEFKPSNSLKTGSKKSGFHECWQLMADFKEEDFKKPNILNIWNFNKRDAFIQAGKYFKDQVTTADLGASTPKSKTGLTRSDRQALQIEKAVKNDLGCYADISNLSEEILKWKYPLHFIDFETTSVAIPFNKDMRPYAQVAFQYSHHIVHENGVIEHHGQWLNSSPGYFPNFDFARSLKAELIKDEGTIFRYSPHENTILNAIINQLEESNESDKATLVHWLKSITKSTLSSTSQWSGERNMVDLMDIVLRFYYNPLTRGSNSLKDLLPAILNSSSYLKEKYSKPIYGTDIKSLNFSEQVWITLDGNGVVINPYDKLPLIHEGISNELLDDMITDEEMGIVDGGAAMIAYSKMQFTTMNEEERERIVRSLLKYCELDSFAMVLLWEELMNECDLLRSR